MFTAEDRVVSNEYATRGLHGTVQGPFPTAGMPAVYVQYDNGLRHAVVVVNLAHEDAFRTMLYNIDTAFTSIRAVLAKSAEERDADGFLTTLRDFGTVLVNEGAR